MRKNMTDERLREAERLILQGIIAQQDVDKAMGIAPPLLHKYVRTQSGSWTEFVTQTIFKTQESKDLTAAKAA